MDTHFTQESKRRPAGLSLPVQAPPVYRSAVGTAGAAAAADGVEANLFGLPIPLPPLPPWIPGLGDIFGF